MCEQKKPVVETTVIETSDVIFWLENVPLSVYMLPLEFHRDWTFEVLRESIDGEVVVVWEYESILVFPLDTSTVYFFFDCGFEVGAKKNFPELLDSVNWEEKGIVGVA